jgi:hypothetical protein
MLSSRWADSLTGRFPNSEVADAATRRPNRRPRPSMPSPTRRSRERVHGRGSGFNVGKAPSSVCRLTWRAVWRSPAVSPMRRGGETAAGGFPIDDHRRRIEPSPESAFSPSTICGLTGDRPPSAQSRRGDEVRGNADFGNLSRARKVTSHSRVHREPEVFIVKCFQSSVITMTGLICSTVQYQ